MATVGRGFAIGVGGTLVVVLGVMVGVALGQPQPPTTDRAYCAEHADIIADMWAWYGAPGTIDPAADVSLIAGYYRGDADAIGRLASQSHSDDFPGELAQRDRIDGPLTQFCLALRRP